MASNPLLTDPAGPQPAKSKLPLMLGGAVAVLVAGLVGYLQFAPRPVVEDAPLTDEAKGYVRNLKLADVGMKASLDYFSQKIVEIEGNITNGGDRPLEVVEIYCVFYDYGNQVILRSRVPIVSEKMGGLDPGDTKSFRMPFDQIPDGWNQTMPQLVIAGVTFAS